MSTSGQKDKHVMNSLWRFVGMVESEAGLERVRHERHVYGITRTFGGDKVKYRCTSFTRTRCKFHMCSIRREDGLGFDVYVRGEHKCMNAEKEERDGAEAVQGSGDMPRSRTLDAKWRPANPTTNVHCPLPMALKSSANAILRRSKVIASQRLIAQCKPGNAIPVKINRQTPKTTPSSSMVAQSKRNGKRINWRYLTTVDGGGALSRYRLEQGVFPAAQTFNGEKITFRCTTQSRTGCRMLMCAVRRKEDGKYEVGRRSWGRDITSSDA